MEKIIIPSIIANTQEEMEECMNKAIQVAKVFQLDVMDGKFVDNTSLLFPMTLRSDVKYEAHLMMEDPEKWIIQYAEYCDTIILHADACTKCEEMVELIRSLGARPGIAINPNTPLSMLSPFHVDFFLIMTVHPGQYGAPFVPEALEKIKELRALRPTADIEVDGHITQETLPKVLDAGANRFVVGSYLMKASDIKSAYNELKAILSKKE